MIYSSSGKEIKLKKLDDSEEPKLLAESKRSITSFALHKDYLYTSLNYNNTLPSAILHCKMNYSSDGRVSSIEKNCEVFDSLRGANAINCMAITPNGTLYAGLENGTLVQCNQPED